METNDMKDMWKSGVDSHIKFYSDTELSEIIVKSAGKAMKPIQLGGVFQLVVIAIVVYIVLKLIFGHESLEMKLLDFSALLIILVCSLLWKRSDYKMNKYKCDMPVKEWLEYCIKELKKTIYLKTKFNVFMMCIAFVLGFGFYVASQIILKVPFNPLVFGMAFVGLIVYLLIVGHSLKRNYKKALNKLEELYKQFEESSQSTPAEETNINLSD